MTTTAPKAGPTAPTASPTAPKAPPQHLPARGQPTPPIQPTGPPPTPRARSHTPTLARQPPPPPPENIDPSIHCVFYDTKLKKMLGSPELYAKAFPHSWEAEQFCAKQYNLSSFTPATVHPDYAPRTTPTYAQPAGSGPAKGNKGKKKALATEVARAGDNEIKTFSSLPLASR